MIYIRGFIKYTVLDKMLDKTTSGNTLYFSTKTIIRLHVPKNK